MIQPQAGAATVDGHDFRTIFQNQWHRHRADIPLPILFGEAEAVFGIVAQALFDARLQAGGAFLGQEHEALELTLLVQDGESAVMTDGSSPDRGCSR